MSLTALRSLLLDMEDIFLGLLNVVVDAGKAESTLKVLFCLDKPFVSFVCCWDNFVWYAEWYHHLLPPQYGTVFYGELLENRLAA